MKLVIVESPSKSKTIEKYLGHDYKVVPSKGHIRDLETSGKYGLGVDIENNFKPSYKAITGKGKLITELKKLAKTSEIVFLASDPDREGEAIAWHIYDALNLNDKNSKRVVFNEITKSTVNDAFKNPRNIDMNLVKSQETRRILDRIIGFRLSNLMQRKTGGKSAGRVQSVALKLIVDREREIEAFIIEAYYEIDADFKDFTAKLEKYHGKKIEIKSPSEANDILASLSKSFKIDNITEKDTKRTAKFPFKTSTLQRECVNKFSYSSSKTMKIAQKLYEGIDLKTETVGLITYMRTDSTRLSPVFINETKDYIKNTYGEKYLGYVKKEKENANMQDAHEGIRPTSIYRTPESVKPFLSPEEYKVYKIIYMRALSSLMSDAISKQTSLELENNGYLFKATGSVLNFDGYLKVYGEYEKTEDTILPNFKDYKSDTIIANDISSSEHFTKPLPRYNEASLIKEMETLGIGRPSTYAPIIELIKKRGYVRLEEKKFFPTETGIEITDKLQEFFSNIINVEYTANMETKLDEIAEAKDDYIKVLTKFYNEFAPIVDTAFEKMEKKEPEKTGEVCPECGNELVIKSGKYGKFTSCSNYPKCKYIKKEPKEIKIIMHCPLCDGNIVEKRTKRSKIFYGCTNYPKCNFASWDEPIEEKCPDCGGTLTLKNYVKKCINCNYLSKEE